MTDERWQEIRTIWASNTRRFTDPTHPDFWCSDDPASPAWRGKGE